MDFKAKPTAPATVAGDDAATLTTKGYVAGLFTGLSLAAANIFIADAGSYYTGTTAEAALQEVGALLEGLETYLASI